MCRRVSPARGACILATLLGSGLLAFALVGHPIELPWTAERDDYLGSATTILDGALPCDPFRPLLYPLSIAGVAWLTGAEVFLAARIVSVLAATGLVLATHALGRAVAGPRTGLLAALLVGVSGSWWTLGVQAITDVLFALTFLLTILAALRALRDPSRAAAVGCGVAFALCWFTRYTAMALVLPAAAAVAVGAKRGEKLARLAWFVLGACVALLPHVVLTWRVFGQPFHDESWRSMAFRHFGQGDWRFLQANPLHGTLSVLLHDPAALLVNAAATLRDLLGRELWLLLVDAPYAVVLAAPVLVGFALCARRRPEESAVVGGAAAAYAALLCLTYFAWERLLFPLLPVLAVALACAAIRATRSFRPPLAAAATWTAIAALAVPVPARLARLVDQHPLAELAAARELLQRHGRDTRLIGTYWAMGRHVPGLSLPPYAAESVRALIEEAAAVCVQRDVDFLVVGRLSLRGSTFVDLERAPIPRHLQVERADADVRVYRIAPVPLEEWAGPMRVDERHRDVFSVELPLPACAPAGTEVWAHLLGPQGRSLRLDFSPAGDGTGFALTLNLSQAPGRWVLEPRLLHPDGTFYAGAPLSISAGGP